MSAFMVALRRLKSGGFVARKVIPRDVRDEYCRMFGKSWEEKLRLPQGTPPHEAKARHGEWLAEIETRIGALRAGLRNEARPLTRQDAQALAARWFAWFVSRQARDGRPAGHWQSEADQIMARLLGNPASEHIDPGASDRSNSYAAILQELAAMVSWLASDDCSLSTGSVFDLSSETAG